MNIPIITVKNYVDKEEMKEKLIPVLKTRGNNTWLFYISLLMKF